MRAMVGETSVEPRQLILPMFVAEGLREPRPISSMPGVVQHTLDTLRKAAVEAADAGLAGVMLFGVPEHKDARGSGALDPDGILTAAIRAVREEVGDACLVMSDVCLDEFTDHGHCGVLTPSGAVDNDATIEIYAQMAVLHAAAGTHLVGPSGMMDGQVGAIRDALDAAGASDVAILAYSVKYASAFYGPFREAVASSLSGNRRTYQQDPANIRRSAPGGGTRRRAGCRHRDGQACARLPGCGACGPGGGRSAGRGVQRVRRVRHGRGGSGQRLDHQGCRDQ